MAAGADGIELDLRLSKDRQVVVYHDADLAKAGHESLSTSDLTADKLCELDVGSWKDARFAGHTMPLLADVLDRYAAITTLLLEVKIDRAAKEKGLHHVLASNVIESMRPRAAAASWCLLSFDFETLQYGHSLAPDVRAVLSLRQPLATAQLTEARYDFLYAFAHRIDTLAAPFAEQVHTIGKPLMTWPCNTEEDVEKALSLGVKYIMTDRPGWLRELLDGAGEP